MKFELTVSGLCAIAMRSSDKMTDPRPRKPEAVDIIVPKAPHHQCRLVWLPGDVTPFIEPELIVDTAGQRFGSLDMRKRKLQLLFPNNADTGFEVVWGPPETQVPAPGDESLWMNWVPMMESIGLNAVPVPRKLKTKGKGVRARFSLPFGKITASEIVMRPGTTVPLPWRFADNSVRAVANNVLYTVDNFEALDLQDHNGQSLLQINGFGDKVVRMCLSNDMETVPTSFNIGVTRLDHLMHLAELESDSGAMKMFKAPEQVDTERTGDVICTQVVNVYDKTT